MSIPFAFAGVILIWSTTPLAIKWSSEGPGFLFGVASRMALGALLCVVIMALLRQRLPLHSRALHTYVAAGLGLYAAMLSVYWGAQYVPSGLVSVIFGLTPLVTGLLAMQLLSNERFGIEQLGGSIAGVVGLAIIFNTSLNHDAVALKGVLAVLVSVILHSISSVRVKHCGHDIPALAITTGGLLCAVPLYLLTWAIVDHATLPAALPMKAGLSILYLGVFGSVIGFVLYYYILRRLHAGRVALITLVTPVIALLIGQSLNGEMISRQMITGTVLILLGLMLHQWQDLRLMLKPAVINAAGKHNEPPVERL
jgi:drug/metabolite transporter (DMT)-like permease